MAASEAAADRAALVDPLTLAMRLDRDVQPRRHLRAMAASIRSLGADDRLLITVPPQMGTSRLVEWTAFWWLCRNPSARVLLATYSAGTAAVLRGRRVRSLVQSYGHRFGLTPAADDESAQHWRLTTDGGLRTAGVGTALGDCPIDIVLVDSPVRDSRVAASSVAMGGISTWWWTELTPRLVPGAPALVASPRWGAEDLSGRLLAVEGATTRHDGRWRVLYLPALAVDPALAPFPDGLGRSPGDPLSQVWVADAAKAELLRSWQDKRSRMEPRLWDALFQGMPRADAGVGV